ncbi:DNA internalization-related competence protein ComEC/Rec2 [Oenococcus sp.]|uniref:DNA internalization-related competence protein ComEC/Rec2 n=2 Tax=Oenococcus sp. TaxID=1979414 RepID=UPI0039ED5F75
MSRFSKSVLQNGLILSLLLAAISGVFFNCCLLTVGLLLAVIVRILMGKSVQTVIAALLVSLLFLLRFSCFQSAFEAKTLPNSDQASLRLRIFADDITIDGDQLRARAFDQQHKQKILLYATVGSEDEKHFWEANQKNLNCLVNGQISKPMRSTNFRQFDVRSYFRTQSISNQISRTRFEEISVFRSANPFDWIISTTHHLRKLLINQLNQLPSPLSDYAKALLIGDLDSDFYDRYPGVTNLGLIHLFSISGFQVSYFAVLLKKFLRKLHMTKDHNTIMTAFSLPIFFIFAGGVQSLIRPVASAELSLGATLMKVRVSKELIWSGTLMIGLFVSPMILFNIGGQLSYLLSFALMYTYRLGSFKTSLFMSLVSMPIVLAAKYSWHLLSMPANFIAIPLFGIFILPLIFLAMLVQIIFPAALGCLNFVIQLFTESVEWLALLPGQIYFGKLADFLVIPLICLIFVLFDEKKIRRRIATALFSAILVTSFLIIHLPKEGELMTFDIGQGDSAFLRTPRNRQTVLIDTGGRVGLPKKPWQITKSGVNQGQSIIVNYLQSIGVGHLDYLVLSHGDMDHIGNAKDILKLMAVKRLLIPAGMRSTDPFKIQLQPFIKKGTEVIEVTNLSNLPGFPFKILHPFGQGKAENEDSIALWTTLGPLRFFTAGDLPKEGEIQIDEKFPGLKVDLLKLGHHGSNTSSDAQVLKKWQVSYGLISAGRHNRYGHPKAEVISLMDRLHVHVFNTQTNGAIRFRYTEHKGFFETFTRDFDDTE